LTIFLNRVKSNKNLPICFSRFAYRFGRFACLF
jgi:hypothetical protein